MWRLRSGLLELRRQNRCTGLTMHVVCGHLVYHFELRRPMLACMWHLFRFVHHAAERVETFSLHVRAELRVCAALLPVCYHDLAAGGTNRAYMSDASLKGYALLAGDFPVAAVDIASDVRER